MAAAALAASRRVAWPTFVALTVVDAVLSRGCRSRARARTLFGALIAAGFFNVLRSRCGALAGLLLRRRRRDLPCLVARDYGGTALLVVIMPRCSRAA